MDLKQIKELMTAMEKSGIKKLTLKEKTGYELHLERQEEFPSQPTHVISQHAHPSLFIPHPVPRAHEFAPVSSSVAPQEESKAAPVEKSSGKFITSPMVGTFYAAASPDDPVFVKVGDRIEENTLVCIIEAMKVMNEVKAGVSGVVAEVFLENGHPVEFGTKLFRIV